MNEAVKLDDDLSAVQPPTPRRRRLITRYGWRQFLASPGITAWSVQRKACVSQPNGATVRRWKTSCGVWRVRPG